MEKIKVLSVKHIRNPHAGETTQDGFKELKGITIIKVEEDEYEDEELFDDLTDLEEYGTEQLRTELVMVESQIKAIVGDDPMHFYHDHPAKDIIKQLGRLIAKRWLILNQMFTCTDDEIKRLEAVNAKLLKLRKQMLLRTAMLYRTNMQSTDNEFDNDCNTEGTLDMGMDYDPENGDYGTVLHLENDEFYGSNFSYMLYVIQELAKVKSYLLDNIYSYEIAYSDEYADMSDEELIGECLELDNGESWDSCVNHPELEHICFCYAFHNLFAHKAFSLPDILRINNYVVEAKITCQHFDCQTK